MATKRNFIHGLLVLSAIMAALLMSAGAARTTSAAQLRTLPTPSNSLRTGPQPLSTIKSSITVHLYNGLVASLTGIAGAGLTLSNGSGAVIAKVVSDSSGAATLVAGPGVYKLHVNASGYRQVDMIVKISSYSSEFRIAMMPLVITDPWVGIGPTDN